MMYIDSILKPLMMLRFLDWKALVEIIILWIVIYQVFLFLKGTNALYLLRGLIILIVAFFIFRMIGFSVLSWLLMNFFAFYLILIVVLFQQEFRSGLIKLGQRHVFFIGSQRDEVEKNLRELIAAVSTLSKKNIGALIAIKREMGLNDYIESGVTLNAELTSELLQTIFYPPTPLHDGGVIIEGSKVVAASCLFPHSSSLTLEKTTGMRHRSGIGLSEHSDAVVVIVSEENGAISLAINGQLTGNLTPDDLLTILKGQLGR